MELMFKTFTQDFRDFGQMLISTGAKEIWLSLLVWLILILLPLTNFDRRDIVAGWTYAVCLAAFGTSLLTFTMKDFSGWQSAWMQFIVIGFMTIMAAVRWFSKNWGNAIQVKSVQEKKGGVNGRQKGQ